MDPRLEELHSGVVTLVRRWAGERFFSCAVDALPDGSLVLKFVATKDPPPDWQVQCPDVSFPVAASA
jgi:hypothetical protein